MQTINPKNVQATKYPDGKAEGYWAKVKALPPKREGSICKNTTPSAA